VTAPRGVALVTGAGHRVGRAIALGVAEMGFDVAVHYHASASGAEETATAIRALGRRAVTFGADLADAAAVQGLVPLVVGAFGRLDLLVNSASVMDPARLLDQTPGRWDATFAVNVRAPYFLSLAAATAMAATGGAIVNLGDHLAEETMPGLVAHGISKAAVHAMTEHLAVALAPAVRVNAVVPGWVLSPAGSDPAKAEAFAADTPLQRLGDPADVVAAVRFLVDADYATGTLLRVNGGRHLRG
jgi:pteridine reductase